MFGRVGHYSQAAKASPGDFSWKEDCCEMSVEKKKWLEKGEKVAVTSIMFVIESFAAGFVICINHRRSTGL